jgi:uncharacterized membrane protein YdbT with pleckstrin-like domain
MSKLKERWDVTSNFQVLLIIIVFSLNGSFATYIAKPATALFGLHSDTSNPWLFWPVRIFLVFFIYQFTLPIVGFFFGQYKFFSKFSKKTLSRIGFKWLFKKD